MKNKHIFFNEDSGAFKHGDLIEIQISDDFKDDDIVFYEVGGRCEHDIYSEVKELDLNFYKIVDR